MIDREIFVGLDIPVNVTDERGPYKPGINLWRFVRRDLPSRAYPYRGTLVKMMYEPQGESEERYAEWSGQVREVLLNAYPDRYRPMPQTDSSILIEDEDTTYSHWRAAENAKRSQLGFKPLHEVERS